jgi:hypothetical protein
VSDDKILPETLTWISKHLYISKQRPRRYMCQSPRTRRMLRADSRGSMVKAINEEFIRAWAQRWRDRIHHG